MAKSSHPVQALRDYATALEAAMTVALAEPTKPAVHRMRTLTRRLDAQVTLLSRLEALPPKSAEAKQLARRLKKLRRAAGRIRDLDVQREMLETNPSLPQEAALELRDQLHLVRERRSEKLQKLLHRQLPRIAGAIEQLLQSLATANGLVVPDLKLVATIERWKVSQDEAAGASSKQLDDDQLHDARKASKAARYMAESVPGSAAAKRSARQFEAQQDAGGRWHDWLDLAATSKEFFGRKHPLTKAAKAHCEKARAEYLKLLGKPETAKSLG